MISTLLALRIGSDIFRFYFALFSQKCQLVSGTSHAVAEKMIYTKTSLSRSTSQLQLFKLGFTAFIFMSSMLKLKIWLYLILKSRIRKFWADMNVFPKQGNIFGVSIFGCQQPRQPHPPGKSTYIADMWGLRTRSRLVTQWRSFRHSKQA